MILVRHGESHFNVRFSVTREDPGILDPGLTDEGLSQAKQAAASLRSKGGVRRVVASPYWRTLQTAEVIAEALGLDITIETLVRERAYFACDVGSPSSALSARWPGVSFNGLAERWWPSLNETEEEVLDRSQRFRRQLLDQNDWRGTVVVTHWGFIRALTGELVHNGAILAFNPEDGSSRTLAFEA